jgi:hypothetical protein
MKVRLIGSSRLTEREARALFAFLSNDYDVAPAIGMARAISRKLELAICAAEQRSREAKRPAPAGRRFTRRATETARHLALKNGSAP